MFLVLAALPDILMDENKTRFGLSFVNGTRIKYLGNEIGKGP
jgi:hypothetical protein